MRRVRRVFGRSALILGVLAALILGGAVGASAHSYFIGSDPPDGSLLEKAPAQVVLVFSSPVDADYTRVTLVEAGGTRLQPTSVRPYQGQPGILVVRLPNNIPNGSYRLDFSTRDKVDLHATEGTIVFGIGVPPPKSAPIPRPVPAQPSEFVVRWLALAGLASVLGGAVIAFAVVPRMPVAASSRAQVQSWLFALAACGSGAVLVGEAGLLVVQASSLGSVLPSAGRLLAESTFGTRWLITESLALALAALFVSLWSTARTKEVPGIMHELYTLKEWFVLSVPVRVFVLATGLTAAIAFSGHVAGASGSSVGGEGLLTLHVGSMAIWAGGVVALGAAVLALWRATGELDRGAIMSLVVGFGPIAAVAFATLCITGLLLAGLQVASVTSLLSTQYGLALIGKIALITVVALIGFRHARWTWRGLSRGFDAIAKFPRRLPLTLALEGGGALLIVLLASVMGASAPATGPQFEPLPTGVRITQATADIDGMAMTLSVKPNQPGPNLISVVLVDKRRPAPAEPQAVTIQVNRPGGPAQGELLQTSLAARSKTRATFDAGSIPLDAGDARFHVTVVRPGMADSVVSIAWKVSPLPVTRARTVVSDQQIGPIADVLALIGAIAALLTISAGVRRARGRPSWPGGRFSAVRVRGAVPNLKQT